MRYKMKGEIIVEADGPAEACEKIYQYFFAMANGEPFNVLPGTSVQIAPDKPNSKTKL